MHTNLNRKTLDRYLNGTLQPSFHSYLSPTA